MKSYFLYILFEEGQSILDMVGDIATIAIAVVNTFLVWWIYKKTNNQGNRNRDQARKIDLLKSLILDHNLKHLYGFFEDVEKTLGRLKARELSDTNKSIIIEEVNDQFIELRKKFTDTLLAIDQSLYDSVLESTDRLQETISNNTFDAGNNLNHIPRYEECIENPIKNTRTSILKILFQYKG